jgi:Tfp pilus assembly protein PilE
LGPAAYFILMESGERGATFGKRVLKLRVVDTGGNRIGKGRAAGRWVAHALSYITLYIGYFIQPFTGKKQALHDMVSGTVVVKTEKTSNTIAIVVAVVVGFFFAVAVLGILAAVAIPAYQDYIVKAKTSAAYSSGQQATTAVTLFYQSTGRVPATLSEAGLKAPLPPFLSTLEVNPNTGEVQLTFNASAPGSIANKSMVFTPSQAQDGSISWKCSSEEIRPNLLPQSCR